MSFHAVLEDGLCQRNLAVLKSVDFDPSRVHCSHFNGRLYRGFLGQVHHHLNNIINVIEKIVDFVSYYFRARLSFYHKHHAVWDALELCIVQLEKSQELMTFPKELFEYLTSGRAYYRDGAILDRIIASENLHIEPAEQSSDPIRVLGTAIRNGHGNLVKVLLQQGFLKEEKNQPDGFEPLIGIALRYGRDAIIELLIREGVSLNGSMRFEVRTPLHALIVRGKEDLAILAVEFGADVNALDCQGLRAVDLPEVEGMARLKQLLEEGQGRNIKG